MKNVKKEKFFNGVELNKLNRKYDSLDVRSWDDRVHIYLKHTSFTQVDIARAGRNGVSSLVQLQDQLIECESVYFDKSWRGYVSLYIKADANQTHGFGSKVLLIYRDSKGRKESRQLFRSLNRDQFESDLIGSSGCFNHLEKLQGKSWDLRHRYKKLVRRKIQDLTYRAMYDLELGHIPEDLVNAYAKFGIKLIKAIPFTHEFSMFHVKFVKQDGLSFKIGGENTSTYCSLPETIELKVQKRGREFIPLRNIGLGRSGYYNHSENLAIRPDQLKVVKSFQLKFNKESKNA